MRHLGNDCFQAVSVFAGKRFRHPGFGATLARDIQTEAGFRTADISGQYTCWIFHMDKIVSLYLELTIMFVITYNKLYSKSYINSNIIQCAR